MADKEIKVKFTADGRNLNEEVKKAEKQVRSFGNQAADVGTGVGKKLLKANGYIAIITKGLQAWGQVIKTFVFDRPLEALKDYVEAVQRARESLEKTGKGNAARGTELQDVIKQMRSLNESELTAAQKQAEAARLMQNARVLSGGKNTGLGWQNGQITGLDRFEVAAEGIVADRAKKQLAAEIKTTQEQMAAQREVIRKLSTGAASPWTKSKELEATKELDKLTNDLLDKRTELAKLERDNPAARKQLEIMERQLKKEKEIQAAAEAGDKEAKARLVAMGKEREAQLKEYQRRRMENEREYATRVKTAQASYMNALKARYEAERNYIAAAARLNELLHARAVNRLERRLNRIAERAGRKVSTAPWYDDNPDTRSAREKRLDEGISEKMEKYGGNVYGHLSKNEKARYDEINEAARKRQRAEKEIDRIQKAEEKKAQKAELAEARSGVAEAAARKQEAGSAVAQLAQLAQPMAQLAAGIDKLNKNNVWFVEGR